MNHFSGVRKMPRPSAKTQAGVPQICIPCCWNLFTDMLDHLQGSVHLLTRFGQPGGTHVCTSKVKLVEMNASIILPGLPSSLAFISTLYVRLYSHTNPCKFLNLNHFNCTLCTKLLKRIFVLFRYFIFNAFVHYPCHFNKDAKCRNVL